MTGAFPTASASIARRRAARLLLDRWRAVLLVVLLGGLSSAPNLLGPRLIGHLVDEISAGGANQAVIDTAVGYAVLAIIGGMGLWFGRVVAARLGESALDELRQEVFGHAFSVPIDVVERGGTGELIARITGDVAVLSNAIRQTIPTLVFASIQAGLMLVALMLLSPLVATISVGIAAIPIVIGARSFNRRAPSLYLTERQAHAGLASKLLETLRGRETLLAFDRGASFEEATNATGVAVMTSAIGTIGIRNMLRTAVSIGLALALFLVVAIGTIAVPSGALTVGVISAAGLYLLRLYDPVMMLLEQVDAIQQVSAATARLVGITEIPAEDQDPDAPAEQALPARGLDLRVGDLHFRYDGSSDVLKGLDFHLEPGTHVAIVGASGAGKSTLGALLAGLRRPTRGQVLLGGQDLHALAPHTRSERVALIAQEGHLFARSIADNVRLARQGATEADICKALEAVDALEWVQALPHGMHTVLAENDRRLSPGQRQQVALARLLCADPDVVILDEATADLDVGSARIVERHLDAALAGRTVISIAHRLDNTSRADVVYVMDQGVIVERGTHDELIASEGSYAMLYGHWMTSRAAAGPVG